MTGWTAPAVAGVAAGLAVAVPLGAVGVLLLQEGMQRGWRAACAAAAGIATVDVCYASLACVAGGRVSVVLEGHRREVRVVSALVLALVALRGLLALRRDRPAVGQPVPLAPAVAPVVVAPEGSSPPGRRPGGSGRTYGRFVGITAVNPLTAVAFLALASALGGRVASPGAAAAFVAGVGLGSLAWQLVLAGAGTAAGSLLGRRARWWTAVAGNAIVLALAVGVGVA